MKKKNTSGARAGKTARTTKRAVAGDSKNERPEVSAKAVEAALGHVRTVDEIIAHLEENLRNVLVGGELSGKALETCENSIRICDEWQQFSRKLNADIFALIERSASESNAQLLRR